jgi:hypothetical protein
MWYNRKDILGVMLGFLAAIWIFYVSYQWLSTPTNLQEGFEQNKPFVMKTNESCYDDVYFSLFTEVYESTDQISYVSDAIIEAARFGESEKDKLLDVQCDCGRLAFALAEHGSVWGMDSRPLAIEKCREPREGGEKESPLPTFLVGNIVDPSLTLHLEPHMFSHMSVFGYQLYLSPDLSPFFESYHKLLHPRGILILQLVDPEHFVGFKPPKMHEEAMYANVDLLDEEIQETDNQILDLPTLTYTCNTTSSPLVQWTEQFKDKKTGNIRQQIRDMFLLPILDILQLAINAGFKVRTKIDLAPTGAKHEYLYILENTF